MKQLLITIIILFSMQTNIQAQSPVKIIAHRGAWKEFNLPENSIAALNKAIDLKVYGSEFDIRRTLDGELVVNHDPEYYNDTIELKKYETLSKNKLSNGENLPKLKDYLIAGTKGKHETLMICEIKQGIVNPELDKLTTQGTLALVKELGIQNRVVYISFGFKIMQWIKELDPNAIVLYLENDKDLLSIQAAKLNGINYHFSAFQDNALLAKEAIAKNLLVGSWTVNEPTVLNSLIQEGVKFITTNYPAQFLNLVSIKY